MKDLVPEIIAEIQEAAKLLSASGNELDNMKVIIALAKALTAQAQGISILRKMVALDESNPLN